MRATSTTQNLEAIHISSTEGEWCGQGFNFTESSLCLTNTNCVKGEEGSLTP